LGRAVNGSGRPSLLALTFALALALEEGGKYGFPLPLVSTALPEAEGLDW
jgi:hypothetical protein